MPLNRRFRRGRPGFFGPAILLFTVLKALLSAVAVQFLWNRILPDLFSWKTITYWQAVGLWLLCRLLFGTLFHPGGSFSGEGPGPWQRRGLRQKWMNMSEEEREKFKQEWRNKCKKKE